MSLLSCSIDWTAPEVEFFFFHRGVHSRLLEDTRMFHTLESPSLTSCMKICMRVNHKTQQNLSHVSLAILVLVAPWIDRNKRPFRTAGG